MTEMSILQWADRMVAATPAEQAQLRWLYRAGRRQIVVIPPGVNTERFNKVLSREAAREILGINLASNLLLFVGRIEPLKAVDTILEALHVLRDRAPSLLRNLHFMIVGGDPKSGRDHEMNRLQELSVELGIDQLVSFVGAKEQSELPIILCGGDGGHHALGLRVFWHGGAGGDVVGHAGNRLAGGWLAVSGSGPGDRFSHSGA